MNSVFRFLIIGLGLPLLITSAHREYKPVFASNVKHIISKFNPTTTTASPYNLMLSTWELNLTNEFLIDIMVSKCTEVNQKDSDELKVYISEQLVNTQIKKFHNLKFIDVYDDLIKCLEIVQKSFLMKINKGKENDKEGSFDESSSKEIPTFSTTFVKQNGQQDFNNIENEVEIITQESLIQNVETSTSFISSSTIITAIEMKTLEAVTITEGTTKETPQTKISSPSEASPPSTTAINRLRIEKQTGILDSISHLFSQLYQNTENFVFSLLGRKKRHADNPDVHMKESKVKGKPRKNVKVNDQMPNDVQQASTNNKLYTSNRSAKLHFLDIIDGVEDIAKASCPDVFQGINRYVKKATREILWYIYEDLDNASKNGEIVTINVNLQKLINKCKKEM